MHPYRISAGAIVEHEARLLMVHHVRPGRYDFWVAPGGGVKGDESYEQAATREVWEETGLEVNVERLVYIEDLVNPECRFVKFWFLARLKGGTLNVSHPEAELEHVTEAAWLEPSQFTGKELYPEFLLSRYTSDRAAGFPHIVRIPLRHMNSW